MPAAGDQPAEHSGAGRAIVEVGILRVELVGETDDLLAGDGPSAIFADLPDFDVLEIHPLHDVVLALRTGADQKDVVVRDDVISALAQCVAQALDQR